MQCIYNLEKVTTWNLGHPKNIRFWTSWCTYYNPLFISGKWTPNISHRSMVDTSVTQYATTQSRCWHCDFIITFNDFPEPGSNHFDFGCIGLLLYCQRQSSTSLSGKMKNGLKFRGISEFRYKSSKSSST